MNARRRFLFAQFYFWYYAAIGAYTPYVGRWVNSLGHGGYVVGAMLGLWYASRVVAPPAWAALTARSARPGMWLVYGCAFGLLCFAGFTLTRSTATLLGVMLAFGFFYNALLPQFEAMTLTALGADSHDYGRIRLWGSAGFLIVAGCYGAIMDHFGDAVFPWICLPLLVAVLLAAWPHRDDRPPAHIDTVADAGHLWKRPGVRRFLLVAMLAQAGFGTFYVFYTLHLQDHHHDGLHVGILWAAGVLAEIAMFWFAPGLIARVGAPRLLSLCLAIGTIRWAITALFADSFAIMFAAQLTHAFSFAVFQACLMRMMVVYFPGARAAAGQSLLYGFCSGFGGVLGAAVAAVLWQYGRGEWAFLGGAVLTALAWIIYAMRSSSVPATATAA
ncbi:MAG TPA: MFS transporter [Xanthomonadaceae bacterium]|jgi:PPP family 3-phenylpropionic acid transporter|nr:MFS transporter [Xanthomonadaceae bacterium]